MPDVAIVQQDEEQTTTLEDRQAEQLALLPKSKLNQYVGSALLDELKLFQQVKQDIFGDYLLFRTFPCYSGKYVSVNTIEYRQVDLSQKASRISFASFLDTFKHEGSFSQRALVQTVNTLIDLEQQFAIYRHHGDDLAFSIITHHRYERPDSLVKRLGIQHYFVFRTSIREQA